MAIGTRNSSPATVEAVHGNIRITIGHFAFEYTTEQAVAYAEAIMAAVSDAGPVPTWVHEGVTYNLTQAWRSPRPWIGWHWRWLGTHTPDGVPLMTPVGTGDDDLIGSGAPFDRVLADEKG